MTFILLPNGEDCNIVPATLHSLAELADPNWQLITWTDDLPSDFSTDSRVRDAGSRIQSSTYVIHALSLANGRFVYFLESGDRLHVALLAHLRVALQAHPDAALLYGDTDCSITATKRSEPWFKPEWDPHLFLAQDFVSDACFVDASIARRAADAEKAPSCSISPYSLLLSASRLVDKPIVRIPHILSHVRDRSRTLGASDRLPVVQRFLARQGAAAEAGPFNTVRARWPLPTPRRLVSIIIPTRDKVELLRACVDSILARTDYAPYEIIVVDNDSSCPATLIYLQHIQDANIATVLRWNKLYNYSEINNFAVGKSTGSIICLLNNDTEIVSRSWLSDLVRYAIQPDIGAVGAMLLYSDRTIQHAGVVVGMGGAAGHAHRYQTVDTFGYFGQAHVARKATAVTAACLAVERTKFDLVGGLDAKGFGIAYNDVDFCLKLQAAGLTNIYTPDAILYHHESKSRGSDFSPEHIARYRRELALLQERWSTLNYDDPTHHPDLDRSNETYTISF